MLVISLLSYVVVLAMSASMAQQIYTIARWDYVKETQRRDSILVAGKAKFFDVGSDKVVQAFYYTRELSRYLNVILAPVERLKHRNLTREYCGN